MQTKDKCGKDPSVRAKSPKQSTPSAAGATGNQSFWDVLVKLDQIRLNKKGLTINLHVYILYMGLGNGITYCIHMELLGFLGILFPRIIVQG